MVTEKATKLNINFDVIITLLYAAIISTVVSVSFRAPAQSTAPRELAYNTRCTTKTLFKLSRNDLNIN